MLSLISTSGNINNGMNYVRPINIRSPFTGELGRPKIVTTERDHKIYTEAHWYCPNSGQFIKKGLIKVEDKSTPNQKD